MYIDLGTISTRDPVDNIASLLMWSGVFHFHQSGLSVVWGRKSILTLTVDNDGRTASESPWLYGITIEVCFSSSVLRNMDDALWLAFRRKDLGLFFWIPVLQKSWNICMQRRRREPLPGY